jgi:hypothetical protein
LFGVLDLHTLLILLKEIFKAFFDNLGSENAGRWKMEGSWRCEYMLI